MKCPHCQIDLVMSERQGVEIDYCPKCRGVWLDRGELDKIIERSAQDNPGYVQARPQQPEYRQPQHQPPHQPEFRRPDEREYRGDSHYKPHKKKSWLGDILDFD